MSISLQEVPDIVQRFRKEVGKVIVGQEDVLDKILMALLCRGHVLLIGVPGMAKTTMVNSFAQALSLTFNRIQFTPDLMPSDILGTEILQENKSTGSRELVFHKGPVFTQILLADEINRTPPKTQAALLQSMQEKMVTVFGRTETPGRALHGPRHPESHRAGRHLSPAGSPIGSLPVRPDAGLSHL